MSRFISIILALVASATLAIATWAPASGMAQTVITGNGETVVVEDPNSSPPPEETLPPSTEAPPPVATELPPLPPDETTIEDLGIVKGEEGTDKAPKSATKPARRHPSNPQRQSGAHIRPFKRGFGYTIGGHYPMVSLNQTSKKWGGKPFCRLGGGRTIKGSGCGVTALTMVGRTLHPGSRVSPVSLARKYCSQIIQGGVLSYFHGGGDIILTALLSMGLEARRTGGDLGLVANTVQRGGLAIILFAPGPFTGGGHFLVIRGFKQGKFYLADPWNTGQFGRNNENRGFTANELRASAMVSTWTAER
ncbi:hypothetical protein EPO04_01720 [Patescibacteria group bacterium]|nr:MAG: hypothetical protein EPO04_01720 [Patescibacteria group bacterium]